MTEKKAVKSRITIAMPTEKTEKRRPSLLERADEIRSASEKEEL